MKTAVILLVLIMACFVLVSQTIYPWLDAARQATNSVWIDSQRRQADAAAREREAQAAAVEAEAAARAQAAAVEAAQQPARQGAITSAIIGLMAGLILAGLGVGIGVLRYAWLRSSYVAIPPVEAAGRAFPLIAHDKGISVLPSPQTATSRLSATAAAAAMGSLSTSSPPPQTIIARRDIMDWQPPVDRTLTLPIGVGADGPVSLALLGEFALGIVGGLPGTGKTTFMRAVICGLLRQDDTGRRVQIMITDPKRTEYSALAGAVPLWRPIARTPDEIISTVHDLRQELDARFERLDNAGAQIYTEINLPLIVGIIDELAVISSHNGVMADLLHIGRMGRSAGITLLAGTQRPSARNISGELRALADFAICLRVRSAMESRIVMDAPGGELLPYEPGAAIYKRSDLMRINGFSADSFRPYALSLPHRPAPPPPPVEVVEMASTSGGSGFPPVPTGGTMSTAHPRLQRNQAPTPEQAALMRQQYQAGISLNRLCASWYGTKDSFILNTIRDAVEKEELGS